MGLFSGILKAVAGPLIGGLFGKKSQPQTTTVNYQEMVDSAIAAKFNPLTVLRNGGTSGFQTTSPALSGPGFLSEALQAGVSAGFGYKQDQRDEEKERLQLELLRQEVQSNKNREKAFQNYGFTPPSVTTYTGSHENTPRPPKIVSPRRTRSGDLLTGVLDPNITDLKIAGSKWNANENFSDAEAFEQRYGDSELGSMLYGATVGVADFEKNVIRPWMLDRREQQRERYTKRKLQKSRPKQRRRPYTGPNYSNAI